MPTYFQPFHECLFIFYVFKGELGLLFLFCLSIILLLHIFLFSVLHVLQHLFRTCLVHILPQYVNIYSFHQIYILYMCPMVGKNVQQKMSCMLFCIINYNNNINYVCFLILSRRTLVYLSAVYTH